MQTRLPLSVLFLLIVTTVSAQQLSGTWHGFQVSRDKGHYSEYRITMDLNVTDKSVTGTMQLKSPQKGVITSSLSGKVDLKENLIYLKEDEIVSEGITPRDASLCTYVLKIGRNSLRGKGRSSQKGYDHLTLRLQRGDGH